VKINQLKVGVLLSYLTMAVQIVTGMIYTPVMLRLLGQSEFGLYQLVSSVVSSLSLLSFGFGSCYMRFYSQYATKGETEKVARLNGMFLIIFSVLSAVCLLCGLVMMKNIELVLGSGLTESELKIGKILLLIMVFSMALTFMNSVFVSIVTAHEKFFFLRLVEFLRTLCSPFLTLPLLLMGLGSVSVVSVTLLLTILATGINLWYTLQKLDVHFSFRKFDFKLLKEMWTFTFFVFFNLIVDQLNWNIDKFLLGRMLNTRATAIYSVAAQLNSMFIWLSTAISSVFIPKVNFLVAQNCDNLALTKLFTKVGRIQFLVLWLVVSGFILFGKEFIAIWAGPGYGLSFVIALFLIIPITIPLVQNLGIDIQRAKNMHKARSVIYFLIAVCNIFLSILLIFKYGTVGAAMGTAISLILGNVLFMNIYYHKKIGLNMLFFWKEILAFFPAVLLAGIGGFVIQSLPLGHSIAFFLIRCVLYALVYGASMWFLGMKSDEKALILDPIHKLLQRR